MFASMKSSRSVRRGVCWHEFEPVNEMKGTLVPPDTSAAVGGAGVGRAPPGAAATRRNAVHLQVSQPRYCRARAVSEGEHTFDRWTDGGQPPGAQFCSDHLRRQWWGPERDHADWIGHGTINYAIGSIGLPSAVQTQCIFAPVTGRRAEGRQGRPAPLGARSIAGAGLG